jgi:hypothetical protein
LERERVVVAIVTRIQALFARLLTLIGFSVQQLNALSAERGAAPLDDELGIADVSLYPWPGARADPEVCAEIAAGLSELLDECPAARGLLRNQTFARRFH